MEVLVLDQGMENCNLLSGTGSYATECHGLVFTPQKENIVKSLIRSNQFSPIDILLRLNNSPYFGREELTHDRM